METGVRVVLLSAALSLSLAANARAEERWRVDFENGAAITGYNNVRIPGDTGTTFSLTDLEGRPIRLADLRGKGVWINFWASWCPPCQAETPILRDTYAAYRDKGLELVAVAVQESSAADVTSYAERYGLSHPIGNDASGDIFRLYRVFALPTQIFVGPDGVIRSVVQGPLDADGAASHVETILPSPGETAGAAAP